MALHDQRRVHAGDADGVLRVLLGELLVDHAHVLEKVLLVADGDEIAQLVGGRAPNHGRVLGAEGAVGLAEPSLLVLVREAVGGREERAGRDASGEEVRLGGETVKGRHQVLRREGRLLLDDAAERLNRLVTDHRLLLCREVLQRGDEELVVPAHVL